MNKHSKKQQQYWQHR